MGRMKLSFFLHAEIFIGYPKPFLDIILRQNLKMQHTRQSQYLSLHNE